MEKKIAVYDITDTITEIELNAEKIFNIATIFNNILGEGEGTKSHSTIAAEIKDENSILRAYYNNKENFEIQKFAEKLLSAECSESNGRRKASLREGYLFKDKTNQKQYGMDIMWYLWTGKCSSLFGKDDMTTFERYFIAEKETHKENKNPYFTLREDEDVCNKIFKEFELDTNESHIINGHVPVESKNGESPIKANGRIIAIDGGFSRAYQKKTGIAGYTLIYNSQSLQLVSHEPFTSTEEAIVNESDILSTTMLVEHKLSRKTVKDTDAGKKLLDEVDDLKLLLTAYKKGIIKEV